MRHITRLRLAVVTVIGAAGLFWSALGHPRVQIVHRIVDGRSIPIEERGQGDDIVLLTGADDVSALAAALAGRHRVIVAPSSLFAGHRGPALAAVLDALSVEGAATLVADLGIAIPLRASASTEGQRDLRVVALDLQAGRAQPVAVAHLFQEDASPLYVLAGSTAWVWDRFRTTSDNGRVHLSLLDDCQDGLTRLCAEEAARFIAAGRVTSATPATGTVLHEPMRAGGAAPPMVVVPNGQFRMGETDSLTARLTGRASVRLLARLAVARTETTIADFRRFVATTGHQTEEGCWYHTVDQKWNHDPQATWSRPLFTQTDDHPVTCVTFEDAVAYADWISTQTDHTYRLPTESEFEFLNRGGHAAPYGFNSADAAALCGVANGADRRSGLSYANPCDDGFAATSPAGHFAANDFGLHDTTGNLWELTTDCWQTEWRRTLSILVGRRPGAVPNGNSAPCPAQHIIRGGSFLSSPANLRVTFRDREGYRSMRIGFRLVRELN